MKKRATAHVTDQNSVDVSVAGKAGICSLYINLQILVLKHQFHHSDLDGLDHQT